MAKKAWRHIQRTPIVSPSLQAHRYEGLEGRSALLFHDQTLYAGGVGGSLGSMLPITFAADVQLDLKTGKAKITTGPSTRFGKEIEIKFPNLKEPAPPARRIRGRGVQTRPQVRLPRPASRGPRGSPGGDQEAPR